MEGLRRTTYQLILPMAVVLPVWISFGRAVFGSGGWLMVIFTVTLAPALCVLLIVCRFLIPVGLDAAGRKTIGEVEAILLAVLYLQVFLFGFFVVDGGDTLDSVGSVATEIFGKGFEEASSVLSGVTFVAAVALAVTILVYLAVQRAKLRRTRQPGSGFWRPSQVSDPVGPSTPGRQKPPR
ncbi:hypothetical protein GCM10009785_25770 [Brooklawnia cerclae]|uniref:Preprotein translocase subunit SecG n=1 Tax=Brooklawnia cerclae TaxID=349934 RepID=A0ABX0SAN2_9ACTN|nr:hypothetical protein [Brooklawnia cerclae]NIH55459.1 preprotein translocase subunit SecG [Brooklawnia cerclae]